MLTFARYLLFQLPAWCLALMIAWGLHTWTSVPKTMIGLCLALYVAKDFMMFPWVRSAYEHRIHDAGESLVGATAQVLVTLDPKGWVQLGSERWRAERKGEGPTLEAGESVRVCALRGHTLVVERPLAAGTGQERGQAPVSQSGHSSAQMPTKDTRPCTPRTSIPPPT